MLQKIVLIEKVLFWILWLFTMLSTDSYNKLSPFRKDFVEENSGTCQSLLKGYLAGLVL